MCLYLRKATRTNREVQASEPKIRLGKVTGGDSERKYLPVFGKTSTTWSLH